MKLTRLISISYTACRVCPVGKSPINFGFVVLFALAISVFASCSTIKPIEIGEISGLQITRITQSSIQMDLALSVHNPNFADIKVEKVDIDIKINEIRVGKLVNMSDYTIKGNKSQEYHFPIEVKFADIISDVFMVVQSVSNNEAVVELDGYLEGSSMFVSKKFEVKKKETVKLIK